MPDALLHRRILRVLHVGRLGVLASACCALALPRPAAALWPPAASNLPVCTMSGAQNYRGTVSDGAGGLYVTWSDARFVVTDIYVQHVTADGALTWNANGLIVCAASGRQDQPVVAPDGAGGVIVAWRDYRNGPDGDIYAQRIDASGAPVWTYNGNKICGATGQQSVPVIVADAYPGVSGLHGAFIAWDDERDAPRIYAQHVHADGTTVWAADGVPVTSSLAAQFEPDLVADGFSGAVVTWSQQNANDYDVWSQHLASDGSMLWGPAGLLVCGAAGDQYHPVSAFDGKYGFWIAWQDARTAAIAIELQHLTGDGLTMLAPGGQPVCSTAYDQAYPVLAPVGLGGAYVAWTDARSGGLDIYAQRLDAWGFQEWNSGGIAVCSGVGLHAFPAAAADGTGGLIIAWEDSRSGGTDIYAQRLDPFGVPQWAVGGTPISTSGGNQYQPSVVSSGDSTAIVVWSDGRNGNVDLYAQRVPLDAGTLARQPPRVLSSSPNPARETATFAFELHAPGRGELTIFDAAGRRVRTVTREQFAAGDHRVAWDARDDAGRRCAEGVYFARLVMNGRVVATRSLALTR